jgi:hypothetical protein
MVALLLGILYVILIILLLGGFWSENTTSLAYLSRDAAIIVLAF